MNEKELTNICSNCGSDNDLQNDNCEVCGAPLNRTDKKEIRTQPVNEKPAEKTIKEEKKLPSQKENKKKSVPKQKSDVKEVNTTKLYYIIGILLIVGAIVIFASGIFDEPQAVVNNSASQNLPTDHNHSGVDLSSVKQINDMEQALKANPNDHKMLLNLAHLLNDSGFYDRAIVKYKEYLQTHPNEADVLVDLGVCYFNLHDYPNAEKYMNDALKISPNHQIAHFNLGIVAVNQNKNNEAVSYWNKAIEINPASEIASKAKDLINQYQ